MSASKFHFIGGSLALDFVNTVANRLSPESIRDDLATTANVQEWARAAGLTVFTQTRARIGQGDLCRILKQRDDLYVLLSAMARGDPPPARALKKIDRGIRHCRSQQHLSVAADAIRWRSDARGTDELLCAILENAAELLTSESHLAIKQCADEHCGWLFVDRSQARRRRWCRMADCGNRAKARKHYRLSAAK